MSALFNFLTFFVITACLAYNNVDAQRYLPNINFLGQGYDLIIGNPLSLGAAGVDPGFRKPVLRIEYQQSKSDSKWFIPDNVEVRDTISCSFKSASEEVTGTKSYLEQLSVEAAVEGEVTGIFKFSASAGYKQVKKETSSDRRVFLSSVSKCTSYEAFVNQIAPYSYDNNILKAFDFIRVSNLFALDVKELPLDPNDRKYVRFISTFGTHYVTRVIMGAKAIMMNTFSQRAWMTQKRNGFNFKVAASASFLGIFSAGYSVLTEEQKQQRTTFEKTRSDVKQYFVGSHPPADGKLETWARETGLSPLPISYQLYPLTNLFTTDYLPEVDASTLAKKQTALLEAIKIYCRSLPGCKPPVPDPTPVPVPVPVKFYQSSNVIVGVKTVSCPPGYRLISCGYSNVQTNRREVFRRAIPISDTTCECYDYFGARCHAWCTNAIKGFQIVTSGVRKGTFSVYCPSGSKVVGCHSAPNYHKHFEKFPVFKPTSDGQGCFCYDYFGTNCIASCATNIRNHEVRSNYGKGKNYVSCSPGNSVLGCGFEAKWSIIIERWREYNVHSRTSCHCYDAYGGTCYAICGKLV